MAVVSIAEAADWVGRDRKTLYRAIKEGRLSATLSATGEKQVDIAELTRVYGVRRDSRDSGATVAPPQNATPTETVELLRAQVSQLRELIEAKDRHLQDKDRHIDDLRASIRLLELKTPPAKRRGWWPFR